MEASSLSILSVIPPLLVLTLGIWSKRVLSSLVCGIVSAGLIARSFNPITSMQLIGERFWAIAELGNLRSWDLFLQSETLLIFLFLANIGIIVVLLGRSGGALAYTRFVKKWLHDKRSVETASIMLSFGLFIDDYFNTLTVGTVMHPLTDEYKVPRAKLAFLVDSMAAPLAIIVPISSWIAVIIGQLHKTGITPLAQTGSLILGDPFFCYIKSIPFIAYSFMMIGAVILIVRCKFSFGPMRRHEQIAETTGNVAGGKPTVEHSSNECSPENISRCNLRDFFIPVVSLILSVFGVLLYSGGFYLLGGTHGIIGTLQNAQSSLALAGGSSLALIITTVYFLIGKKVSLKKIPHFYHEGASIMAPAMMILLLAWTLGEILKVDLLTGNYLASLLIGNISIALFPAMFFIASGLISFAMGSSWGTFAIVVPIALPMLTSFLNLTIPTTPDQMLILFPVIGAILSGAATGDHLSPISDTTIMAATSSGAHMIDHVSTQAVYALPAIMSTTIAFLAAGYLIPYGFWISALSSLALGFVSLIGQLAFLNYLSARQAQTVNNTSSRE